MLAMGVSAEECYGAGEQGVTSVLCCVRLQVEHACSELLCFWAPGTHDIPCQSGLRHLACRQQSAAGGTWMEVITWVGDLHMYGHLQPAPVFMSSTACYMSKYCLSDCQHKMICAFHMLVQAVTDTRGPAGCHMHVSNSASPCTHPVKRQVIQVKNPLQRNEPVSPCFAPCELAEESGSTRPGSPCPQRAPTMAAATTEYTMKQRLPVSQPLR